MRAQGYITIAMPGRTVESDTRTCAHCQRILRMHDNAGKRVELVGCKMCDSVICVPCAERARCAPFEKQLEIMEARGRMLAAMES